jgi:peptidoglycan hydrolase-like protein with peptidoglycan-binding domain
LQLSLRSAGFAEVPIAGRYNAATVDVIKTVQKSRHLKRTGAVNAG